MASESLERVLKKYPRLAEHGFEVGRGKGPGYAEFYHPKESRSPRPGVPYIEIRKDDLKGDALDSTVFGDALHYMPEVDKRFREFRETFRDSLTENQRSSSVARYNRYRGEGTEDRSYGDFFERSDLDAMMRGYLAPDENDEWAGSYSDKQKFILDAAKAYLEGKLGG